MHARRSYRRWVFLGGAILMTILGTAPSLVAQDLSAYDEVFFSLRYNRSVDTIVNALYAYEDDQFYLSLQDVFDALQLEVAQDIEQQVARGFYVDEARPYEINVAQQRARIGRETVRFDSSEVVLAPLGLFMRPALFDTLFGLRINVDVRSLSIGVESDEPLPIDLASERAASRRFLDAELLQEDAPLLYGRDRAILRGGVLSYSVGATSINDDQLYRADVSGGMEVAGGDLRGNLQSVFSNEGQTVDYRNVQWRFVPERNTLLTEARVGEINSEGLRNVQYRGLQLSNAPVQIQRVFGYQRFEGETEPGWEVELLINRRLVDFTTADETGHYAFAIPVTYGTTLTTIRMYGPNGQFEEIERRLQVPFSFVPVGDVFYTLDVGEGLNQDRLLGQFNASVGLSSWLTSTVGAEYIGTGQGLGGRERYQVRGGATARLFHHYLVALEVAPGALYRASINAFYPSLASFSATLTRFVGHTFYNQSSRDQIIDVQSNFPIKVASVPLNFRVNGRQSVIRSQQAYSLRPGFSAQFGRGLRTDVSYQLGASDGPEQSFQFGTAFLNLGLNYAVSRQSRMPAWLRGILIAARAGYDTRAGQLNTTNVSLSRNIGRFGRLRVSTTYVVNARRLQSDVQFSLNLPSARATTSVRYAPGSTSINQDLSGSIGWDARNRQFVLEEQSWVGGAAAAIRLFVDSNGNDHFDQGEHVIEEGDVRFRQALNVQRSSAGVARVHNLRAYDRYSLSIDKNTIRNPLWVPKVDSFSFVADPNAFKAIDVPFYASGIVEGTVLREQAGGVVPIAGLRVHLWNVDRSAQRTVPVFRDGQFFEMELRPGDYVAVVDSSQLEVLNLVSDPPLHPFTVHVTEDGDWVSGLDFILRPQAVASDVVEAEGEVVANELPFVPRDTVAAVPPRQGQTNPSAQEEASPSILNDEARVDSSSNAGPELIPTDAQVSHDEPERPLERETIGDTEALTTDSLYVIQSGEVSLMNIARKVYGDAARWREIWQANRTQLPDPNVIRAGQVLRIPRTVRTVATTKVEPPLAAQVVTEYVVQAGDRGLMDIARTVYQDESLWVKIWVANQKILDSPHHIEIGQRLVIPPNAPLTSAERAALEVLK